MKLLKPSAILFSFVGLIACPCSITGSGKAELTPLSTIAAAFSNRQSNLQVLQEGAITRVLADDTAGDRHQRIIVRLENDQTLLIAHNIDLAPRVPIPSIGKTLRFYGEYEWNDEGGVVHWTHKDPDGQHVDGWLEYAGKRYGGDNSTGVLPFVNAHNASTHPSTGLIRNDAAIFMIANKSLFDIRGRLIGNPMVRASPGIYLIKHADSRWGSVKFLHY